MNSNTGGNSNTYSTNGNDGKNLEAGTILCGNYKLLEPIGRGGMGALWKARDLVGKRDVALKFVPKDVQNFESEMERVEDVFEVIEKLHHEHICPLYALQKAQPSVGTFLVMQFIPGIPLGVYRRQMIRKNGAFTVENLAEVLRPVASALDYAHSRRPPVIHRDIKPANILVVTDPKTGKVEDVQLIDFGIAATFRASLTRVSQVQMNTSGTRPYMAPEQWQGKFQDSATDQYALAVTAYELLSGVFPFESDDFQILQQCVLNVPASPIPNLLDPANAAILKALSKSRTERFGTCIEFLNSLSGSAPVAVPVSSAAPAPSKPKTVEELADEIYRNLKTAEDEKRLKEEAQRKARERLEAEKKAKEEAQRLEKERLETAQRLARERLERENAQKSGAGSKPGDRTVKTFNGVEFAFRWCPAGTFTMGGNMYDSEKPIHQVTLTRGFWMLETQVTQAQWQAVMGNNPSSFKGGKLPVEKVSWNDCIDFCKKISQKLNVNITLPTEAQWEYACRAGTTGEYAGNLDEMAWYSNNSGSTTHAVGQKKPNAWGLYDMHGNVWEWCSDRYDRGYYSASPASDPTGPDTGSSRVDRGGSWGHVAQDCRSAFRLYDSPDYRDDGLGLRCLLVPEGK